MRSILLLAALAAVLYAGHRYFQSSPTEAESDDAPPNTTGVLSAAESPIPDASQESSLREQIRSGDGARADRARYQLSRLLRAKGGDAAIAEADLLLEQLADGGGEHAPLAASVLFANAKGEARLRRAVAVIKIGERAPYYAEALFAIGERSSQQSEDSKQIAAWDYLSRAYFAKEDSALRNEIRPHLDRVVGKLLLSPRPTKAATIYKVQSGDTLGGIARRQGTTVDLIQLVNHLDSTMIHPNQSLKIVRGTMTIEVDKSAFRLDLRIDGKYLFSAPVGLGRDGSTPLGRFVVETKQEHPSWQKPGQRVIPYGDPENPLGERWLGFRETEQHSGYGIHGTDQPDSIGKESSAGCIRMKNDDVVQLYRLVPRGTEVVIRE